MITISNKAFECYKNNVHGRKMITIEEAIKILTRNIILADEFKHKNYTHYYYGKLRITVNNDDEIVFIKNNTNHNGNPNRYKKKLLNEIMGIGVKNVEL